MFISQKWISLNWKLDKQSTKRFSFSLCFSFSSLWTITHKRFFVVFAALFASIQNRVLFSGFERLSFPQEVFAEGFHLAD